MDAASPEYQLTDRPPPLPYETVSAACPCASCGYNLLGLSLHGRCPECGWSIQQSLGGGQYSHAPVEFVRRLEIGAIIAEISLLSLIPIQILGSIVGFVLARGGADVLTMNFVSASAGSACYLGLLVGWWLLSTPDPSGNVATDPRSRRVMRVTLVIAAASAVLKPVLALVGGTMAGLAPSAAGTMAGSALLTIGTIGGVVVFIAQMVHWFAAMTYTRRIAARIPDKLLDQRAKLLIWGPVWTLVGMCLLGAISLGIVLVAAYSAKDPGAAALAIIPACGGLIAFAIAMLVFYIFYAMLLDRLRTQLGQCRRYAMAASGQMMQPPPVLPIDPLR